MRGIDSGGTGNFCGSVASSATVSKPSGGIRSLHSLSACGLPTPIVAFACIGNVDIQVFSGVGGQRHFVRRLQVCTSASPERGDSPRGGEMPVGQRGPLSTRGTAVRRWRGSPSTAINRFHNELRFFFSLLKRKKEAKKEKSSHFSCTVRFKYHPKI